MTKQYISYIFGYTLSLLMTFGAYILATIQISTHIFSSSFIILGLIGLAVIQLVIQLVFFLHLGENSKSHWNTLAFVFTALIVLIVVIGSLWIMSNLNYNMMTPAATDTYMLDQ